MAEKTDRGTGRQGERAIAQSGRRWGSRLEFAARFGYAGKAAFYLAAGALAAAVGSGWTQKNPSISRLDVLAALLHEPLGPALLAIVALGLLCYALWRIVQGLADPEGKGRDAAGLAQRGAYLASGITYGILAGEAVRLLVGAAQAGSRHRVQSLAAAVMQQPSGSWLVGGAGVVVIVVGLVQFYQAATARFRRRFGFSIPHGFWQKVALWGGRLGYAARGAVFVLIGAFLIQAALRHAPRDAGGLGQALSELAAQPFGSWGLICAGGGLGAYGVYSALLAVFRRFDWWGDDTSRS